MFLLKAVVARMQPFFLNKRKRDEKASLLRQAISCLLSVALLFTNIAPSFAQTVNRQAYYKNTASRPQGSTVQAMVKKAVAQKADSQKDPATLMVRRAEELAVAKCNANPYYFLDCISEKLQDVTVDNEDVLSATVCDNSGMGCVPAAAFAWGLCTTRFKTAYITKRNL